MLLTSTSAVWASIVLLAILFNVSQWHQYSQKSKIFWQGHLIAICVFFVRLMTNRQWGVNLLCHLDSILIINWWDSLCHCHVSMCHHISRAEWATQIWPRLHDHKRVPSLPYCTASASSLYNKAGQKLHSLLRFQSGFHKPVVSQWVTVSLHNILYSLWAYSSVHWPNTPWTGPTHYSLTHLYQWAI